MWSISDSNKECFSCILQNTKLFFEKKNFLREGVHYKSMHRKIPETEAFYRSKNTATAMVQRIFLCQLS